MSYQKSDNGGSYEPINGESRPASSKKWIVGAVIVVLAGIFGYSAINKPGAATQAAVAKADLPMNKNGKLKLFDEHSKSRMIGILKWSLLGDKILEVLYPLFVSHSRSLPFRTIPS